ncbi:MULTISPECIES: hypothetical protein [Streptomyces]|uniref:Uncharacterized protein n=1 Tax=Streptomyces tsukubensis (strain DSM 42081 / NBRC 108919 / NRRL 18488 / 9993) TaxID=1114943 RepID=I2MUU4_STRT9|nr:MULTISPECIES: hypothetical protein [Streptomyces]AZK93041.1 hypothetical protein B7R87_03460 [Streptomyces tsukubensis]EIF88541.1 hypothetical protein [Streptomyces tsukubensis NRRL18488]MYS67047.1 hypothetical protein [Streptomyces sp. SID5473]QKM70794.1 hypothetical protein STSU_030365 [Streptomyces tsukubensis NRRL18488]TAI41088.1 hypothetical protein EWI31_29480 [Streptomyces tsukubensis]
MSPLQRESEAVTPSAPVQSAAELNARIRELWADGRLPEERRGEYEALVLKWATTLEHIERAA